MANLNTQLVGANLQVIDNTGSVQRVNSPVSTISSAVTASFYDSYMQIAAGGGTTLTLPAATLWVVWIKNLHTANNLTVTCTPTGGAAWINGLLLVPGAVFMYWAPYAANPATGGVTAITIVASAAGTPAEVLLAA